jgi:putative CocE/NonD family hydrolase
VESITPMGPASQLVAESSNNVLVYTTAPFDDDVKLAGEVVVTLHATSTALDTDFTARLCIVGDCGCSTNLQEGIVRARYRDSLERPELLEPGRAYEYRIVLGPVGTRVAAGSRLRLDVSSSDFPQWDRNLNTGGPLGEEGPADAVVATQTVLHDAAHLSRVTLPLIA